jgi:ribosomal protein S18 acetylase RimI-like enzyme
MPLDDKRRLVRTLLNERVAADAMAAYYALHHPDDKTELFLKTGGNGEVQGYVCLSRTGMDLFRPLMTMRLPATARAAFDPSSAAALLYSALPSGAALIADTPSEYDPIMSALFDIQGEQRLKLMTLDRRDFEPIINVLVAEAKSYNGLPRYVIRVNSGAQSAETGEIAASAGLNWQSPHFAEIYVHTKPAYRRRGFGRSVVAAIVEKTLADGKIPLYSVGVENGASISLAESIGFTDTGLVDILYEATLKPHLI